MNFVKICLREQGNPGLVTFPFSLCVHFHEVMNSRLLLFSLSSLRNANQHAIWTTHLTRAFKSPCPLSILPHAPLSLDDTGLTEWWGSHTPTDPHPTNTYTPLTVGGPSQLPWRPWSETPSLPGQRVRRSCHTHVDVNFTTHIQTHVRTHAWYHAIRSLTFVD